MARAAEARGGGVWRSEGAARQGAVVGGNARRDGLGGGIDGYGVGCPPGVLSCGLGNHLGEVEGFAEGGGKGGADVA